MPQNFPGIFPYAREALVNYSWADVAAGTGFILYYGWASKLTAGTTYVLTPSTFIDTLTGTSYDSASREYFKSAGATGAAFAKVIDLDFDTTTLQVPTTLRGQAVIRVGWGLEVDAANDAQAYVICRIRKWNGSSETEIASCTSSTTSITAGVDEKGTWTLVMDIPETNYKIGETIRLTIEGWANESAGSATLHIPYDPNDAQITAGSITWVAGDTLLAIALPFKTN
jgi:hypothetical protein